MPADDLLALGRFGGRRIPLGSTFKADMAAKDDRDAAIASATSFDYSSPSVSFPVKLVQLPLAKQPLPSQNSYVTTPSAYSSAPRTRMRCGSWACSLMPKCYSAKQRPSRSKVSLPCLVSIRYRDSDIAICYSSAATVPRFLRV